MVFLADLEQKPDSRWRGLLIGVVIALPVTLTVGALVLPRLRAAMASAASDHDKHARERDAYMNSLCTEALVVERDEGVCGCVLGSESPGMDCMAPFFVWLSDQQNLRCADPKVFDEAVAFCSCVQALDEKAKQDADPAAGRSLKLQGYPRCQTLDDVLDYPSLESLSPSFVEVDS